MYATDGRTRGTRQGCLASDYGTLWRHFVLLLSLTCGYLLAVVAPLYGQAGTARRQPAPRAAVAPATANQPATAGVQGRGAVDAVYELARQATSVSDLQAAMDQAARLEQSGLDAGSLQYLRQLQAWLLNRRGEAYALAATRAAEAGRDDDARKWEQQAVTDFTAAIAQHPQWRAYHNRGVSLAMMSEYDQALEDFAAAVELKPDYANTRFNRAELWLELGRYQQAEAEYTEVLKLDPQDVDSRVGRGHARFYLAKFDDALSDFDAVIQHLPENAVAHADRADLYAYLGRWKEAAGDYRMAIKLDRSLGRAYQSVAWLMATCPEEQYRDAALALKAAQRAIQLDGTGDYRYLDTLAAAQANSRSFQEATQTLQQALQVAPEDVHSELQERQALYQAQRPFRDTAR